MTAEVAEQLPRPPGRARPDCLDFDGIIDWPAVLIAAEGSRRVELSGVEQEIAAALIMGQGGSYRLIEARLHVSNFRAWSLYSKIRHGV